MSFRRTDAAALQPPVKTKHGVLYTARVASTGALNYTSISRDGELTTRTERRTREELQRFIRQLPGTVVTLEHPRGMVADSPDADVVGIVESARLERGDGTDHAVATIRVTDSRALDAIADGSRGISLGYQCTTTEDDDGIHWQQGVTLDHVAIVAMPRCKTCFLRGDRADQGETMANKPGCACSHSDNIDDWDPDEPRHDDAPDGGEVDEHDWAARQAPDESKQAREAFRKRGGYNQGPSRGRTREQALAALARDRERAPAGSLQETARTRGDTSRFNDAMNGGSVWDQVASGGHAPNPGLMPTHAAGDDERAAAEALRKRSLEMLGQPSKDRK